MTSGNILFVNSELQVEPLMKDIAGEIKIGETTLPIDNPYTIGLNSFTWTKKGGLYTLTLEKK